MMEVSKRNGWYSTVDEKKSGRKKWMKKREGKDNMGQIKEHELTQRNKVKQRCKTEGRL